MAETYRTAKGTNIDIGGMLVILSPGDVIHIERVTEPPERTTPALLVNKFESEIKRAIAHTRKIT
jgi:hypothetical protein